MIFRRLLKAEDDCLLSPPQLSVEPVKSIKAIPLTSVMYIVMYKQRIGVDKGFIGFFAT